MPDVERALSAGCRALHPGWEWRFWDEAENRKFLLEHYPWFLPLYDSYEVPVNRNDAVRYFYLLHYGGVYLDFDVGCLRPLDELIDS